jgi:hypothetical protein
MVDLGGKAYLYVTSGISGLARWTNWYLAEPGAYQGISIRLIPGMHLPPEPRFLFNPFRMDQMGALVNDTTASLLERSFVTQNENHLTVLGFSSQAAKLMAYLRLCLVSNGTLSQSGINGQARVTLVNTSASISLDHTSVDHHAYKLATEAWSTIVFAAIGAYCDVGHQFSPAAADRAEALWLVTKWATMLEEYNLQWAHIFRYVLQPFCPEALLLAASFRMLTGGMASAPIYDTVSYRINQKCALPMISPWGPTAIPPWWRACVSHAVGLITTHRHNLRTAIASMPADAFHPHIQAWITTTLDPYLDVLRILLPVLVATLRPMYMPALQSNLYLAPDNADRAIAAHAEGFARMLVAQAFGQSHLTTLSFSPRLLDGVSDFRVFVLGVNASRALVPADERLLAWGIVPGTSLAASTPNLQSLTVISLDTMNTVIIDDTASVADTVADAEVTAARRDAQSSQFTAREHKVIAFRLAKKRMIFEEYTDVALREILERPRSNSIFKMFWRPELCKAKKTYDRYLRHALTPASSNDVLLTAEALSQLNV